MAQATAGESGNASHKRQRRAFLSHGDVPLVLLGLLEERSMHGYEMIKSLEERSGGLYKPSAGAIYPTLSMLEDQELIESVPEGRKKVFSITVEGREYLEAHAANGLWRSILTTAVEEARNGGAEAPAHDPAALRARIRTLFGQFFEAAAAAGDDPEKNEELDHIIEQAEEALEALIQNPRFNAGA